MCVVNYQSPRARAGIGLSAPSEALTARKVGDATWRRLTVDLHVRLGPPMDRHDAAVERPRPGTVRRIDAGRPVEPAAVQATVQSLTGIQQERCDVALLDWLKHELDNALDRG